MLISKITVNGVHANATKIGTMTTGMVGAKVQFTFDSSWDGLIKTAVFRCMDITKDVLNIDSEVTIPHEVLTKPGYQLCVGVYGTNAEGTLVIPTVWATVGIVYSGADPSGDPSTERSPDVWEQLQAQIDELREQGVDDATIAAAVEKWLEENPVEVEIPETLPNPHKLTFTGAVTAEYDGSKPVEVKIPEGGSGGGGVLGISITNFPRMDGETDDAPRIQRAFDSIPKKEEDADGYYKGLVVYFPRGTYKIARTVTGVNVGIVGDTGTEFVGTGTGYMFDISFDGELGFAHVNYGAKIYQWRNFPVEKCVFNGNGKMDGLKHTGGHNIAVRDSIFCDTVSCGYYIASGSKYFIDHVTFRGISEDASLNALAINLGGSDHNVRNVIIANYTKGIVTTAANSFFSQCHMWLNHNARIPTSVMFDIRVGGTFIDGAYIDTIKYGLFVNTGGSVNVSNLICYNNPVFTLYDAVYIKMEKNADLFVSGATIDDSRNARFIDIEEASAPENIRLIGIRGNCHNIYETYTKTNGTTVRHTIKNELQNVSTSNFAGSVLSGSMYTTTLAADVGYKISSVKVMMGGVDITDTAYNGSNKVSISSVTGDVVITATAEVEEVSDWDIKWQAGEIVPSTLNVDSNIKQNSNGELYNSSEWGKRITFANGFDYGAQWLEVDAYIGNGLGGTSFQISILTDSGTGTKVYDSTDGNGKYKFGPKNHGDVLTIQPGGTHTFKFIYDGTNITFAIDDNVLSDALVPYSETSLFQGINMPSSSVDNCRITGIRWKQL